MTIDISPEAVELIAAMSAGTPKYVVSTLRALSAALTASQAETAAAYDAAIGAVRQSDADCKGAYGSCENIRALTPAASKAALDRMIAEARAEGMREAAGICAVVRDTAKNLNIQQMAMGAIVCRDDILAAIPKGKDHE